MTADFRSIFNWSNTSKKHIPKSRYSYWKSSNPKFEIDFKEKT